MQGQELVGVTYFMGVDTGINNELEIRGFAESNRRWFGEKILG